MKNFNFEGLSTVEKFKVIGSMIFINITLYVGIYHVYYWMFTKICKFVISSQWIEFEKEKLKAKNRS